MANGEDGKSFRQSISRGFAKVKDYIVNSPDIVKGLLAAGLMLTTVGCLVKTKRVPKKV